MPSNSDSRIPPLDPPVGPSSEVRAIHDWLDELAAMRQAHAGNARALEAIEREADRAIGWLRGRDELSGAADRGG